MNERYAVQDFDLERLHADVAHDVEILSEMLELRVLFEGATDEDLRRQITALEAAFRRPDPWPATWSELNRVRQERIAGQALLDALSRAYRAHGLEVARAHRDESEDENDELSRIVLLPEFRPFRAPFIEEE